MIYGTVIKLYVPQVFFYAVQLQGLVAVAAMQYAVNSIGVFTEYQIYNEPYVTQFGIRPNINVFKMREHKLYKGWRARAHVHK